MSWEQLPDEIQVQIFDKLTFPVLETCRQVSRGIKKLVDGNKRRLPKRQLDLVRISADDDWEMFILSKEERKRKKLSFQIDEKRAKISEYEGGEEIAKSSIPSQLLSKLTSLTKESIIKRLELYEINVSQQLLSNLTESLNDLTVETIEISMSSFKNLDSSSLKRFLTQINPKNVRLSWIRELSSEFFYHEELMSFLKKREVLEMIYLTDSEGKRASVPLKLEELFSLYSIHLDESSVIDQDSIESILFGMSQGNELHHLRLETSFRPISTYKNLRINISEHGFSVRRIRIVCQNALNE